MDSKGIKVKVKLRQRKAADKKGSVCYAHRLLFFMTGILCGEPKMIKKGDFHGTAIAKIV